MWDLKVIIKWYKWWKFWLRKRQKEVSDFVNYINDENEERIYEEVKNMMMYWTTHPSKELVEKYKDFNW